jgi:DNA-binding IclR family transcriptional regulator
MTATNGLRTCPPMDGITQQRRLDLVAAIDRLTVQAGYPPTIGEVAAALGLHPSSAHSLAHAAVKAGLLQHTPGRSRSWRVAPHGGKAAG